MKQLKSFVIILLLTILIIPSVASASWWNPFSWSIWNIFKVQNIIPSGSQTPIITSNPYLNSSKESRGSTAPNTSKTTKDSISKNSQPTKPIVPASTPISVPIPPPPPSTPTLTPEQQQFQTNQQIQQQIEQQLQQESQDILENQNLNPVPTPTPTPVLTPAPVPASVSALTENDIIYDFNPKTVSIGYHPSTDTVTFSLKINRPDFDASKIDAMYWNFYDANKNIQVSFSGSAQHSSTNEATLLFTINYNSSFDFQLKDIKYQINSRGEYPVKSDIETINITNGQHLVVQ